MSKDKIGSDLWSVLEKLKTHHYVGRSVIETLGKEGPLNIYQIAKKERRSYSVIFRAVKRLEGISVLKMTEERKNEKGVTSKIYELTLLAIPYVVSKDNVERVMEKWQNLDPLILGKWRHLTTAVDVDAFVKHINAARIQLSWVAGSKNEEEIRRCFRDAIYEPFFTYGVHYRKGKAIPSSVPNAKKWIKTFKADKEIKEDVLDFLSRRIEKQEKVLAHYKKLERELT